MKLTTTPDGIFLLDISKDEMVVVCHKESNDFIEVLVDPFGDLNVVTRENMVRQ